MEKTLNMGAFEALDNRALFVVDGGGRTGDALMATAGAVLVAWSPVVAVAGSVVATPAAGICSGMSMCGLGLSMIGNATH